MPKTLRPRRSREILAQVIEIFHANNHPNGGRVEDIDAARGGVFQDLEHLPLGNSPPFVVDPIIQSEPGRTKGDFIHCLGRRIFRRERMTRFTSASVILG